MRSRIALLVIPAVTAGAVLAATFTPPAMHGFARPGVGVVVELAYITPAPERGRCRAAGKAPAGSAVRGENS